MTEHHEFPKKRPFILEEIAQMYHSADCRVVSGRVVFYNDGFSLSDDRPETDWLFLVRLQRLKEEYKKWCTK